MHVESVQILPKLPYAIRWRQKLEPAASVPYSRALEDPSSNAIFLITALPTDIVTAQGVSGDLGLGVS